MRSNEGRLLVRDRSAGDVDACVELVRVTHELDGYPVFLRDGDYAGFLVRPDALAAWVAELDGAVVGHVALHSHAAPAVMALAATALGVGETQLGVIARLVVEPSVRRQGVARALLATAVAEARLRGLEPVLDVVPRHASAVALYEATGWERLGTAPLDLPDGRVVEELVYRAP